MGGLQEGKRRWATALQAYAFGAALLSGVAFVQSPALAGSDNSFNSWAGDYQALALPAGTLLVLDYMGMDHANTYVQNSNNLFGKKGLPETFGTNVGVLTDITRLTYFTTLFGHPLVLEGALTGADVVNANIDGNPVSSKSGIGDTVLWATYGLVVEPKNERYLGVTGIVYLPTGVYDKNAAINPFTSGQYTYVPQIGFTEGLSKYGLHNFWFDFIGNASIHTDGTAPLAANLGFPLGVQQFDKLTQDTSYDVKAFLRYDFGQAVWLAVGVEKSWGGNQIASGGVLGNPLVLGPTSLGTDDYLKGHVQFSMPITRDIHVALDLKHDFEVSGGLKEDFGSEFRLTKFFLGAAPLEQPLK